MFKLEVEISLYYVPPMDQNGRGIRLTREFDLPIPPFDGLSLTGNALNVHPAPEGFKLDRVTWDVDRRVFLAWTQLTTYDWPIAFIPDEIRSWLDRGWQFRSLADTYQPPEESDNESEVVDSTVESEEHPVDDPESWQSLPPRQRPRKFSQLLHAIIRTMAVLHNNWVVAYAIDKTNMVFSEQELKDGESPAKRAFLDAECEFRRMSQKDQFAWREQVIQRYPRLNQVIADW